MENYTVMKALGQGTWGVVHQAEHKQTKRVVAIKKIKAKKVEDGIDFTAIREIKLLKEFKHDNIIELVDVFTSPDFAVCLVYECASTDLLKILSNKSVTLAAADVKAFICNILRAVAACHERWILHRDLKPDNFLIMSDGTLKLADFGLARMYGSPKVFLSPQAITLWYKPAELLLGAYEYSSAADIWSVGCIFAELFLRQPFLKAAQNNDMAQLEVIFTVFGTPTESTWPDYTSLPLCSQGLTWDDCPPCQPFEDYFTAAPREAIQLMRSLLVLDPNNRLSAEEALSHPYFTNDPPPTPKEKIVKLANA